MFWEEGIRPRRSAPAKYVIVFMKSSTKLDRGTEAGHTPMNTVALLVLVGDGQSDLEGLADLLRSLECYEPRIARVILVDDARGPRDLTAGPCRGSRLPITVVRHPRLGRTAPKNGVLSSGVLTGLTSLCGVPDLDFVLKIDVDALVIAPFRERLSDFFRTHPRAGLVGCRGDTCDPAHHRYRACLQRPSPFLRAIEWLDHVPQPPFANTR